MTALKQIALYGCGILALAGLMSGGCVADNWDYRTEVIHVESKDLGHKRSGERGSTTQYMVFAREGVYESRDSLVQGKWDSADVYGKLTPGKSYRVQVCGVRWPLFSMFPNIVRVTEEAK